MEILRKIIRIIIGGIVFLHAFECIGQNIYNSKTIYYNIDTLRCVDNVAQLSERNKTQNHAGYPDSIKWMYFKFKENIDLPIVTVNNIEIIHLIDSCIIDAGKRNYLMFPDSSGYFVELLIFEKSDDSLSLDMSITPISNYYMGWSLAHERNDVLYEWYGHREKNLQGCFFLNNILCVIATYAGLDYKRASCLFSNTQSTIRLALFIPISLMVSLDNTWSKCEYQFENCVYEHRHTNIKNDD